MGLDDRKIVIFKVCDEEYAINIEQVERIIEIERITRIPEAPGYLKGVINDQGRIIPVIDLKTRFGLFEKAVSGGQNIIVAKKEHGDVGMVVDLVSEVVDIPKGAVHPTPETITGIVKDYVDGVIKLNDRVIVSINLEKILNFNERQELNEILD